MNSKHLLSLVSCYYHLQIEEENEMKHHSQLICYKFFWNVVKASLFAACAFLYKIKLNVAIAFVRTKKN